MSEPVQDELWGNELKVDRQWFHVVRSMIMGNKIAEMGVNAWAVYCVLKAYTQMDTGRTFPSQETIGKHLDLSVDTVARATDRLVELGVVDKRRVGRRNEYVLIESFPLKDARGDVVAVGTHPYAPMKFAGILQQLQDFAKTGVTDPSSPLRIVFNVNLIQQGDNGTVNIQQISVDEEASGTNVTEQIRKLRDVQATLASKLRRVHA